LEVGQVTKSARILNLGAGVQSTTLALMGVKNWEYWSCSEPLPYPAVGLIDLALFADTQGEPKAVYEHLEWLKPICERWFPVLTLSRGSLSENLMKGVNATVESTGGTGRFVSIPAFTSPMEGQNGGMTRRQCTSEYKTEVLERHIRREVLGLAPGQAAPKNNGVTQLMGLSYDETARVIRVKARLQASPWEVEFPLWAMEMTRGGCKTWLKRNYPERTIPRSACVYCPYHSNAEWRAIKESPEDWAEAVRIDEGIRNHDWTVTTALKQKLYLHRSCVPLAQADLREADEKTGQQQFGFLQECEGMCGV
jgi:hypothetical protein